MTTDIFAEDEAAAPNAFQLIERADGTSVAVSIATTSLRANGNGVSNVVVIHDKTNEQEFLARLSWQASHDELTELPNRREFERRLQAAIEALGADGAGHALMFLDLDQFKVVNDTCGHAAGDQLLRQVAAVLRITCGRRTSGAPGRRRVRGPRRPTATPPRRGRCEKLRRCRRADEFRLGQSELPDQREHRARPSRRPKHDGLRRPFGPRTSPATWRRKRAATAPYCITRAMWNSSNGWGKWTGCRSSESLWTRISSASTHRRSCRSRMDPKPACALKRCWIEGSQRRAGTARHLLARGGTIQPDAADRPLGGPPCLRDAGAGRSGRRAADHLLRHQSFRNDPQRLQVPRFPARGASHPSHPARADLLRAHRDQRDQRPRGRAALHSLASGNRLPVRPR